MNEFTPRAAVIFGDRSCAEMLKGELLLAGFVITEEEKNADLLLTEADFLSFIPFEKRKIAFLAKDTHISKAKIGSADAVLDYNFSLSELNKLLKSIFAEILLEKKEPSDIKKKETKAQNDVEIRALPDGKNALVGNNRIGLSTTEWRLLDILCRAAERGESVSREELGLAMGHGAGEGGNIVDVYVCRLRKKLELPLGRRLIYTVRGSGYTVAKRNTEGLK